MTNITELDDPVDPYLLQDADLLAQGTAALLTNNRQTLFDLCHAKHNKKLTRLVEYLNDQNNDLLYAAAISNKTFEQIWPPFATYILTKFSLPNAKNKRQQKAIQDVIDLFASGQMPTTSDARRVAAAAARTAAKTQMRAKLIELLAPSNT